MLALAVGVSVSAQAQTFSVLYNFKGPPDGAYPEAGLLRTGSGTLYGTTWFGGTSTFGTVFKLDSGGIENVVYSFNGTSGNQPSATMIRDESGNLYGTTTYGGDSGYGVVFKLDTAGNETVLHSFAWADGCDPDARLIRDKAGNLYGTTVSCGSADEGTAFKLTPKGTYSVLHNFLGYQYGDGGAPRGLALGKDGDLYGVTGVGGAYNFGTVYMLSKSGDEKVLYNFAGGTKDGCGPIGTPVFDAEGNIYGTTNECGSSNLGTVWELNAAHHETLLHSFAGGASDGEYPYAGVVLGANGNIYGDTLEGGTLDYGTIFRLNKKGVLTLLHSFNGTSDGGVPYDELIRDAKGNIYGTAMDYGSDGYGTVWKYVP
jgi:uncharacterized repeat protein (TIGR03803 family)